MYSLAGIGFKDKITNIHDLFDGLVFEIISY